MVPEISSDPLEATAPPHVSRSTIAGDLRDIAADLFRYRELLVELTVRDLRIRYKQAAIGLGWAVVNPLTMILAGVIIRYAFASLAGSTVAPIVLGGLAVKSVAWSFFIGAFGFGTASITSNLTLVTKVYFPRELLPLSSVLTQAVDTAVVVVALAIAIPLLGVGTMGALLWLPVLALLLVAFTTAVALLFSVANAFYRDARYVVQLVTTFGIFFTPVFFDLDAFSPHGAYLFSLNPLTGILEGARLVVIQGHDLTQPLLSPAGAVVWTPWYLVYSAAWSLFGLVAGALIFHRLESRLAEVV